MGSREPHITTSTLRAAFARTCGPGHRQRPGIDSGIDLLQGAHQLPLSTPKSYSTYRGFLRSAERTHQSHRRIAHSFTPGTIIRQRSLQIIPRNDDSLIQRGLALRPHRLGIIRLPHLEFISPAIKEPGRFGAIHVTVWNVPVLIDSSPPLQNG